MDYKEEILENNIYKITTENNKTFYYKANNNMELTNVVIKKVDKLNEFNIINAKVNPAQIIIYTDEFDNLKEIVEIIKKSLMNNYLANLEELKVSIEVNDPSEKEKIDAILKDDNINYEVKINEEEQKKKEEEIEKRQEEKILNGETNSSIITKEDNDIEKEYLIHNDKIYENNDDLINEKNIILNELLNDPVLKDAIMKLNEKELDDLLMERIALRKKSYRMEMADNNIYNQNKEESIANSVAYNNDGIYNQELGIIQNSENNSNEFNTIETNDNEVRIVNPETAKVSIKNDGQVAEATTQDNDYDIYKEESQEKEEEKVYYLDDENNIYDSNNNLIGKIGENGYEINYEDNSLTKDNQKMGYLDNLSNLKNNNKDLNNTYVKKLTKPIDNNKAFINIYGFIGIIIILILIITIIMVIK